MFKYMRTHFKTTAKFMCTKLQFLNKTNDLPVTSGCVITLYVTLAISFLLFTIWSHFSILIPYNLCILSVWAVKINSCSQTVIWSASKTPPIHAVLITVMSQRLLTKLLVLALYRPSGKAHSQYDMRAGLLRDFTAISYGGFFICIVSVYT